MMPSAARAEDHGMIVATNVTPLVEICLVLLIIMMVTARIIANLSVPMDLPKAAKATDQQVLFGVDLAPDGAIVVDGKQVDVVEKVLPLAKEALSKNPEIRATIRADATIPHGKVMRGVDLLKQAGISRIAFGASPIAPEPGAVVTP